MRAFMPLPKDVSFVTFDVYGTLIDWEQGVYDAFQKEAARDGFTIDRDELISNFHEIERQIESGSYELYAEVLRRTAVRVAAELEWELEPSRAQFLQDRLEGRGRVLLVELASEATHEGFHARRIHLSRLLPTVAVHHLQTNALDPIFPNIAEGVLVTGLLAQDIALTAYGRGVRPAAVFPGPDE